MDWTSAENKFCLEHPEMSAADLMRALDSKHGGPDSYWKHRKKLQEKVNPPGDNDLTDRFKRLGRVSDLLEKNGIDIDDVGNVERIRLNDWQGLTKNDKGEAEIHDLEAASIMFTPKWAEGPAWPVVAQAPPVVIKAAPTPRRESSGDMDLAVIVPDPQIGYYRDEANNLIPTHDERALWLALQTIKDARPDRVVLLGDMLDLPELSRYRKEPAFVQTTQATINRATKFVADIRANVPKHCVIDWLEGNHEVRLSNYIKDNAAAAFGLKPGNLPASWPVLSVPTLCRLDDLKVTYHAGYPAATVWLSDRIKVGHGTKASKGAFDARRYLEEERVSVIVGHSHRRQWAERTRSTRNGPRTTLAFLPGCLCRIDGKVPGTNTGYDLGGEPIESWEDWQQGLAVVSYTLMNGPFVIEPVPIHHGEAWWRGKHYRAPFNVEGN